MTAIFGIKLLNLLGINIDAFRIAGGIVIGRMGLQMLKNIPKTSQTFSESMLVVPLAFPMISGPGAISSLLIAQAKATTSLESFWVFLAILLIMATFYSLFFIAAWSSKFLSQYILLLLFKLSSIILLALSVDFIIQGSLGLFYT